MRLTLKVSTLVIALAVIISVSLSYIVHNLTEINLEKAIGENQLQSTKSTMQSIDLMLYERQQDIQDMAGSILFCKFLKGGAEGTEVSRRFASYLKTSGPWDALEIYDKDGRLAYSSKEGWSVGEPVDDGYEQEAIKAVMSGKVYISDLVVSEGSKNPTVYFAAPVIDEAGAKDVIGTVIGQYSWIEIEKIIRDSESDSRMRIRLLNSTGQIIAEDGNRERLLTNYAIRYDKGGDNGGVGIVTEADNAYLRSFAEQTGHDDFKGFGWKLVMDTPKSFAYATAMDTSWKMAEIVSLIMFIEVIIMLVFLQYVIIKPLMKLQTTAKQITTGNLGRRASISSKDEIGSLAQSFNEMTDKLLETAKFPESIIGSMADSLIVLNADKKIQMVNKAAQELIGYQQGEILGESIDAIMACETDGNGIPTSCIGIQQLISEGAIKKRDERVNFRTKSGELIPVSISGSVIKSAPGEARILIVAKDLREMQKLEKEKVEILEQSKREMEEKIKERTMNLDAANQQLLSSNKKMEQANKELAAAQKQLLDKVNELERFNKITMGREAKILELKAEISRLKRLKDKE